jgi:periplasmic divalent cation tolerance protein
MLESHARHILVYITAPTPESARTLAETLVRERLVACVNILDMAHSLYWWDGAAQNATESICLCKTTRERYSAVEARVRGMHPYEVPCIVALPIEDGFRPFLDWITRETLQP